MSASEDDLSALANGDPATVTVWSDLGCPWATLALHTLRASAAERGQELVIDHRAFPLELFNREPTPKFIVDAEIIVIAGQRPELGWRLWSGSESTYPCAMLPAMEAVQAAKSEQIGGLRGSDELDAALRKAFYVDCQCVSIHSVILDAAEECEHVDAAALAAALARGDGRAQVYQQWEVAKGPRVQGSPHLFGPDGFAVHNPGATYGWTGSPYEGGFPFLRNYDPKWTVELLDLLAG